MPNNNRSRITQRLNKLFNSGPIIRHAIPTTRGKTGSSIGHAHYRNAIQDITYPMGTYGNLDRISRLADYNMMDSDAVISSALDIYADECTTPHEDGRILKISSKNSSTKKILEELYYDIINSEFWMWTWIRGMCKYGDYFLQLTLEEDRGVVDASTLPVNGVTREEKLNDRGISEVEFKVEGAGGHTRPGDDTEYHPWEICHFRLLGDDAFLPYGKAVINPARRVFKQLEMLEDSMLVYRVTRAAERRVYYIEVGNLNPNEVESYVNRIRDQFKRIPVVNRTNGTYDLRYNPASADEDFFIPVRSGEGSKIESLPGAQNLGDIEDIEYIQKKLFAALKIPKSFLTYEEEIAAKATLSQEDIRFARTIQRVQKIFLAELSKIGIIHLVVLGYDPQDAMDFHLALNNPSTASEMQKIELMNEKNSLAESLSAKFFPRSWIYHNVFGIGSSHVDEIEKELLLDKYYQFKLDRIEQEGLEGLKAAMEPQPAAAPQQSLDASSEIPDSPRDSWRRNGDVGRPRKYPKMGSSDHNSSMGIDDPVDYKSLLGMSHREILDNHKDILAEITQNAINNAENNEELLDDNENFIS